MGYLNTFLIKRASFFDFDEFMTKDAVDYSTWNPQAMSKVENMVMRSHGLSPAAAKQYVQRAWINKGFTPADVRGFTQQMHLEKGMRPRTTPRPAAPAAKVMPKAPAPAMQLPHYVDQHFPLADSKAPVSPKPTPKVAPKAPAMQLPHYVDQHFPLANSATPAPASAPVSPKPSAPKVAPKAPAMQLPHYVDQHFPLADNAAPKPTAPKPAAPNAPVAPKAPTPPVPPATPTPPVPPAAGAADDAAKAALKSKGGPISYGRRMKAIAHRATHNPMRAGKQGWQLAKTFARRNPKLAMLGLIGGSLAGGAMMGSAADSGAPERKMSDATNPYAGFEQY